MTRRWQTPGAEPELQVLKQIWSQEPPEERSRERAQPQRWRVWLPGWPGQSLVQPHSRQPPGAAQRGALPTLLKAPDPARQGQAAVVRGLSQPRRPELGRLRCLGPQGIGQLFSAPFCGSGRGARRGWHGLGLARGCLHREGRRGHHRPAFGTVVTQACHLERDSQFGAALVA